MKKFSQSALLGVLLLLLLGFAALADPISPRVVSMRTPREAISEEDKMPNWTNPPAFKRDVFTFARVHYSVDGTHGFGKDPETRWAIDSPNSDLNFSWRLQQITSMLTDPDGRFIKITDKELFDYPFIYVVEPGRLTWTDEEIPILQRYLLNGGFLMFDDFWANREWDAFEIEMKRLFPKRPIEDLPLTHPIFTMVMDLKEKPQVPGVEHFVRYGRTHERGEEGAEVHYRGISDDKGRLMVMICHNTDLGDGWEREGDNPDYFHQFSEKKAYPMGINILVYTMTH
jgi:hypothetical protein